MDSTTILQAIQAWPVQDRVNLVFQVWDQIVNEGWEPEPDQELREELDRRLAAHEANPDAVLTWEHIEERLRRRK